MKKIRCKECGAILAFEMAPIISGELSIMCNHRKPNGDRCKTKNLIKFTPRIEPIGQQRIGATN